MLQLLSKAFAPSHISAKYQAVYNRYIVCYSLPGHYKYRPISVVSKTQTDILLTGIKPTPWRRSHFTAT